MTSSGLGRGTECVACLTTRKWIGGPESRRLGIESRRQLRVRFFRRESGGTRRRAGLRILSCYLDNLSKT